MSCKDVADFLMDYLDGTLPLAQRVMFKLHIGLCRDCRRYIDSYKKTVELARGASGAVALEDPPEALVRAILKSRPSSRSNDSPKD